MIFMLLQASYILMGLMQIYIIICCDPWSTRNDSRALCHKHFMEAAWTLFENACFRSSTVRDMNVAKAICAEWKSAGPGTDIKRSLKAEERVCSSLQSHNRPVTVQVAWP